MKSIKVLVLILLGAVLAIPLLVSAAEFKGQVVGHSCANEKGLCPLEGLEAHLAMEPDFVLMDTDGTYVYLHNLPKSTKVRHALKYVTVIGEYDEHSKAISVEELIVDEKSVWSWQQQKKAGIPFYGLTYK